RIVTGRAEDFFREVERKYTLQIPVRRGDTGLYWEDGAASTAAELARFRAAQLTARAAEIAALWDARVEPMDDERADRMAGRAEARRDVWRDLLLFGEHTWGAAQSVSDPASRQTVEQWAYKRRFVDGAAAAAKQNLGDALLRIGGRTATGAGRIVFHGAHRPRTEGGGVPPGAATGPSVSHPRLPPPRPPARPP